MPLDHSLLIVASDPTARDLLTGRFIRLGYSVTPVSHPRQALEAATFKQFDVAILQNELPEASGTQLIRRLRQLVGSVKFVLLCSPLTTRIENDAREAGACACLHSTCPPRQLERIVENALDDASLAGTSFVEPSIQNTRRKAVTAN